MKCRLQSLFTHATIHKLIILTLGTFKFHLATQSLVSDSREARKSSWRKINRSFFNYNGKKEPGIVMEGYLAAQQRLSSPRSRSWRQINKLFSNKNEEKEPDIVIKSDSRDMTLSDVKEHDIEEIFFRGESGASRRNELQYLEDTLSDIRRNKKEVNPPKPASDVPKKNLWEERSELYEALRVIFSRTFEEKVKIEEVKQLREGLEDEEKVIWDKLWKPLEEEYEFERKTKGFFGAFYSLWKYRSAPLSAEEEDLVEEIRRRTKAFRRQGKSEDILKELQSFQKGPGGVGKVSEDLKVINQALSALISKEKQGLAWTKTDRNFIRALGVETKRLGEKSSMLHKLARNLRRRKALNVLEAEAYFPMTPKQQSLRFKLRRKLGEDYHSSQLDRQSSELTDEENGEVEQLANQYFRMKYQLGTPIHVDAFDLEKNKLRGTIFSSEQEAIESLEESLKESDILNIDEGKLKLKLNQSKSFDEATVDKVLERLSHYFEFDESKIHSRIFRSIESEAIARLETLKNMKSLNPRMLAFQEALETQQYDRISLAPITLKKLAIDHGLVTEWKVRPKDQQIALQLADAKTTLGEVDDYSWEKLQYFLPEEWSQLAKITSLADDDKSFEPVSKFSQIMNLILKASDRANLEQRMKDTDRPKNLLRWELDLQEARNQKISNEINALKKISKLFKQSPLSELE